MDDSKNAKNQIMEFRISDMLEDGRAFGRSDGLAVFVCGGCMTESAGRTEGAVPGDLVKAEIVKIKKNSAEAKLLEIVEPSPNRIVADCPYFGRCGGCTMQELSYDSQLRLKREQVVSKLSRIGGVDFSRAVNENGNMIIPKVDDMIPADTLKYYRNKAVFSVGAHGEVGFKKAKSDHVMDIDDCMLQSDAAMVCADALRTFFRNKGGRSLGIRQMTVRTAFGTGEVMVALEGSKPEIEDVENLIGMLDDAVYSLNLDEEGNLTETSDSCPGRPQLSLESVALINNGKCRIAAGKATITDEFYADGAGTVKYEISPQSFFQVNPEQMVKLYDKAADYAGLTGGETVLDLYCGAGTIGIWLLNRLRQTDPSAFERTRVIGIESVKPAVLDANRNSVINGLINTRYFCGKAEEELPGMMGLAKLYKWNEVNERVEREPEIYIGRSSSYGASGEKKDRSCEETDAIKTCIKATTPDVRDIDVVVLDPPRAGCKEALLEAVVKAAPDRIVYVSCDPGTLARDVKYLRGNGYEFIEATPVDQFPWTSETEVTCLMVKGCR